MVSVTVTDASCTPDRSSAPVGPVTFHVTNVGATRVSEVEVGQDGRILGEKEDLGPGTSGEFTVELEPGDYQIECPFATTPTSPSG